MRKIVVVLLIVFIAIPARAGIPMGDVLSLAQRIFVWAKKADQWLSYLNSFSSASDHLGAIREVNRMFNLGYQDGLNDIAMLRIDLNRIQLHFERIADWQGDSWRDIFIDGRSIKFKYPLIADYSLLSQNPLTQNPDIQEYVDKFIEMQQRLVERIDQLADLIRKLNEVEKQALKKIGELQQALANAARGQESKDSAAAVSKLLYNLAVVRLTTLRTRLIGAMTMRSLNEIRLKRAAESLEWSVFVEKRRAAEAKNYELIKENNP